MRGWRFSCVTSKHIPRSFGEHSEHFSKGTQNPFLPFCEVERCGAVRHGRQRFYRRPSGLPLTRRGHAKSRH